MESLHVTQPLTTLPAIKQNGKDNTDMLQLTGGTCLKQDWLYSMFSFPQVPITRLKVLHHIGTGTIHYWHLPRRQPVTYTIHCIPRSSPTPSTTVTTTPSNRHRLAPRHCLCRWCRLWEPQPCLSKSGGKHRTNMSETLVPFCQWK